MIACKIRYVCTLNILLLVSNENQKKDPVDHVKLGCNYCKDRSNLIAWDPDRFKIKNAKRWLLIIVRQANCKPKRKSDCVSIYIKVGLMQDKMNSKPKEHPHQFIMIMNASHSTKKPVTTMLTYPWKCTVLHCNHLGNTWKPLVLMTRHFDYCPSASEGDNQSVGSSAPVVSRCFPGGYSVKLYISRGRLAWWLLAFLHSECLTVIVRPKEIP